MKGIIDITIKRKDGTTEHRREHNVVFDIPALVLKKSFEYPEISRMIDSQYVSSSSFVNLDNYFKYFGLSEDTMNLEKPEFRPVALVGKYSDATKWWESVPTITKNDKSLVVQNTWTVQQALTLKSIGFLDSRYPGNNIISFITDYVTNSGAYVHVMDGKLYASHLNANNRGCVIADLKLSNFKFTNQYMGGLLGSSSEYAIHTIPYPLANPNERAAYTNTTFEKGVQQYPYDTYTRLCIYNKSNLDTPLRYFDLSQFSGVYQPNYSSYRRAIRIINTGTKNYLVQFYSSEGTMFSNAWQIPDEPIAEDASIPLVSSNFMDNAWPSGYSDSCPECAVIGNYVFIPLGSGKYCVVRVNDDLSVYVYKGLATELYYGDYLNGYFCHMPLSDSGLQISLGRLNLWPNYFDSPSYRLYNSTAANFSTPITLAEGDVLTISYKIEVA